jgi:hypothetical protein
MCKHGWLELIPTRNPAAGTAFSYRFPGETYTAIEVVSFTLTTSATVANRYPELAILDGDGIVVFKASSPTALAASLVRRTYFAPEAGGVLTSPSGDEALPFISTLFPPGFSVRATAGGIDATDQISSVKLYVRREPSGEWSPSSGAIPYEE